ncbi:MAG: ABC transporter ATP-binding protein [Fretibacterium sp.]|nr:ABC transporter ATP-binding protein [Fretibacterium sp.]
MIALGILMDLVPQVAVIHMIGNALSGTLSQDLILADGALMFLAFFLKAVCLRAATWKAHEAAYRCLTDLRLRIIAHLKELPLGFFQERSTGDLTGIVQHDVEQVEIFLAHGLPEIVSATALPALIFLVMLLVEWRLALLMVSTLPLMALTKKLSAPIWTRNIRIYSDSLRTMQETLMEYVATIPVIKAFSKEETKTRRALDSARDYDYWVKRAMVGFSVPMALIDVFMEGGVVLVMIAGSALLSSGALPVPRFILSVILGTAFTASIARSATLQHYNIVFNQAMARIGSILGHDVPRRSECNTPVGDGNIVVRNLSFSYPGKGPALEGIDLTFPKGSKNALVGESGSGKTTLAYLLMGFWEPRSGSITINGRSVADLSEPQRNALAAIVQQEAFLFNKSLEENIRIGRPEATRDEIAAAAKKARIHDFIMSLPEGYATPAGEAGVKLSGGERQRIALARTILKDAPILILDEATAAVDAANEVLIQEALDELSRDKTVVTIAHRLHTIRDADQIVVMDAGKVVGKGTHEALADRCPLYRKMLQEQDKVDSWDIKARRKGRREEEKH